MNTGGKVALPPASLANSIAILSLAAVLDSTRGNPLLHPLLWALLLFGVAIGCAATRRRAGGSLVAAEPLGMGVMSILHLFHAHSSGAGHVTATAHAGHFGGVIVVTLVLAQAVLCALCVACAWMRIRASGPARALLTTTAAVAMCVMSAALVLG